MDEIPAPSPTMWGRFDYVRWDGARWYVNAVEPEIELLDRDTNKRSPVRLPRSRWNEITLIRTRRCTLKRGHTEAHASDDSADVDSSSCWEWPTEG
jgi:hypothetical protein